MQLKFFQNKEKKIGRYFNMLSHVCLIFVFFFTLFSFGKIASASGEIYDNTGFSAVEFMSPLHTSSVFTADITAEIGSFDFYGGYQVNGGSRTVQFFLLDNANTELDCSSISQTASAWGFSTYPTSALTNVPMSGTQCGVTASTSGYKFKAKIDGAYTDSSYYIIAYGDSSHSPNGNWLRVNGPAIPPDTSSRIDTFTYSTSTRIANITGYWNTHATSSETLSFWQQSNLLGQESFVSFTATTSGAFNFSVEFLGLPTPYTGSTTTAPIIAPYDLVASLDLIDPTYYDPFGQQGLDTSKYKTNLDYEEIHVSTLTYNLDDITTGTGLYSYPEYECGITSITGCLKNAGIWLFYPSASSIEQFKSLGTTLQGKFPFAYAYGIGQMRNELFGASSTPQTISLNFKIIPGHGTSTLELISQDKLAAIPYASTVKTILGWILWLLGIEYIYYRVIRSHDPNTPA